MADRPTIKLKPGAATRDPQRLRVRATTAPRTAQTQAHTQTQAKTEAQAPDADARKRRDTKAQARKPAPPRPAPPRPGPPGAASPRPARPGTPSSRPAPPRPAPPQPPRPAAPRRPLPPAVPVGSAGAAPPKPPRTAPPVAGARPEGIRLSKWLTDQGIASRREADDWIAAGWVRVDGEMAVLGQRVRPEQRIDIDPAARQQQARSVTILLNKPVGYVSGQAEDGYPPAASLVTPEHRWAEERRPFHPGHARGLAPAGRLDIDSTGLLVLTQDGRIAKLLIGEHSLVEKEYLVRVAHAFADGVPESALQLLRHGLELDGEALKPAKVSWANEDQLRIVLHQGKKRQIRRMCEAVGLQVVGLKRVRIGSVVLGKLPAGQWRYLRDDERF